MALFSAIEAFPSALLGFELRATTARYCFQLVQIDLSMPTITGDAVRFRYSSAPLSFALCSEPLCCFFSRLADKQCCGVILIATF
jgi:hypothetical protein